MMLEYITSKSGSYFLRIPCLIKLAREEFIEEQSDLVIYVLCTLGLEDLSNTMAYLHLSIILRKDRVHLGAVLLNFLND